MEAIENKYGFLDEYFEDLEYDMWNGYWGCDIGGFRIQLGCMIYRNQMVDKFVPIDPHMKRIEINLLEEKGDYEHIWWGSYLSLESCLQAARDLIFFQDYTGESGRTFRDYEEKGVFNEAPF